jgi:plasmid stability protein
LRAIDSEACAQWFSGGGRRLSLRIGRTAIIASTALLLADSIVLEDPVLAQLIVRDLPAELVLALKRRAAKRNHSAEQEHREILKAALKGTKRRPLAAVLAAIPNVGEDGDFLREQSDRR